MNHRSKDKGQLMSTEFKRLPVFHFLNMFHLKSGEELMNHRKCLLVADHCRIRINLAERLDGC